MLNINWTGTSSVILTLYENCINQIDPNFTWQIIRDGSLDNIIFTTDDISSNPNIYNKFRIIVSTMSVDLLNGIIPAKPGQYDYYIYEMQQPHDLNLNDNIGVVETGILNIIESPITSPPVFTGSTGSVGPTYVTPAVSQIPVFRG